MAHSGLGEVLTFNISKINKSLIFTLGWVIRIIPKAYFCPIPSPLIFVFQKKSIEVQFSRENWKKILDITIIRGTELDKTEHRE